MNNAEIARGLVQIKRLLKHEYHPIYNPTHTKEYALTLVVSQYKEAHSKAVECLDCLLAMLDEPAPAGTLTVVEVPADDEITRLLKELLASFGISEKEPEPKNCGNCGTSSYDGMNTYQCIHPETLKIIPLGSWTLPFQTCSGWTPRKEAAHA